ncbi:PIN domain-containing protein [Candidatus Woesearchaeota archaeon]|nr:PIN domain-containing protein [Candidatus Woesearchaeota archaeon]
MSLTYVLDTYAWIENFTGTAKGKKVEAILQKEQVGTPILAVAELADSFQRDKADFTTFFTFLKSKSVILPLDQHIAMEAAAAVKAVARKKHKDFGLNDAILYCTAKKHHAIFVTGDHHFKGMENVLFLE